ncbi:MAG: diguanylate cyclase [Clostridium sp.]|nr:diguanylate cyclase [Clostridium sp.]
MKKFKFNIFFIVSLILVISLFIPINSTCKKYTASNGTINLSNYDFNKNVELNGRWDLYFNKLLLPDELKDNSPTIYNIPGKLSDQIPHVTQGYMTLHLNISVPWDNNYGLYIPSMFTASDIWINGVYYDGHGKVGKSINDEQAIYKPEYIFFPSKDKKIDIVIHTSVYREISPYLKPVILGTHESIMKLNYFNSTTDGIIIGILFIMFILNIGFYFAKDKLNRHIYFAAICFVIFMRTIVFNSRLLCQFFSNIPYEFVSKTAAITFYLWVTFYNLFLNDIFDNNVRIKKLAILYGIIFSGICLFTPAIIYDRFAVIAQCLCIAFSAYFLVFMLKRLKTKNIRLNLLSFVVLNLTAINDFLVSNSVIPKSYSAIYGGILFVLIESVFIIGDYIINITKLKSLNKDGLTSLYNNKYIKESIYKLVDKYNKRKEIFSLIMIDVDNFKNINDTYGHIFGDRVLVDVADILLSISDEIGFAGRFGGDEFVLILPGLKENEAFLVAQKIVHSLLNVNNNYDEGINISLSMGVYQNKAHTLEDCLNSADTAMYYSKTNGKNQIINASSVIA